MPLVGATLCGAFVPRCPPAIVEQVRSTARAIALHGLLMSRRLVDVARLFDAASVPVLPYKGPLLSAMVYGGLGWRQFGDLDVWVHPWDYHLRVPELLAAHGWSPIADYGFERSYRSGEGDVVLDVHLTFTPPSTLPFRPGFADLLSRGVDVDLGGATVRTLCAADLAVVLCVQLAKDVTDEPQRPPLAKVCDIAELVRRHHDLDWAEVARRARKLGVLHVVCVALAVAAKLLDAPVPPAVANASRGVPRLGALATHVVERIFDDGATCYADAELRDPVAWNAAIRERLRDRNRVAIALTQRVLAPSWRDYAYVRLPKEWNPCYRVVRPFRIAIERGGALVGFGRPGRAP